MKKLIVLAVAASLVAVAVATTGGGAASGAGSPTVTSEGAGHWFRRACAAPRLGSFACGAKVATTSSGVPLAGGSPVMGSLSPAQFHSAYNIPTSAPLAQTIAIVDAYDDPNIESDLAAYDNYFGLPACTTANGCFRKVNQVGNTSSYPLPDSGWSLEIALDVETAHQICQNCKILLVEASSASFANLGSSVNRAVSMGASVISNSYAGNENGSETTWDNLYFKHPGVVLTASSGDNGYGTLYPAASQYVTAVGGTTLNLNSNGTWASETAWNEAGSGCSSYEAKPAWQTDTGCSHRTIADVSADADPATGAAVYDTVSYNGQIGWFKVGGTSLSSPIIAGIYALTGTAAQASYAATPYGKASQLHDITSGGNGFCTVTYLCTAGPGFDGPTGLGSPNGLGAFTVGGSGPPPPPPPSPDYSVSVSPSSATVVQGGTATYSVSIAPSNGFSGSVAFSQSGLPTGTFSPTSISGSGSSQLSVDTSSISPGTYPFTITATSGSLSHSASATLIVQPGQAPPPPPPPPPPPSGDFSISVSPASATIGGTSTTTYTVTVAPSNGFSSPVTLSASGYASGMSGSFSPNPTTSSSTFTVVASGVRGSRFGPAARITITGTSGSLSHSTTLTLSVSGFSF